MSITVIRPRAETGGVTGYNDIFPADSLINLTKNDRQVSANVISVRAGDRTATGYDDILMADSPNNL